MKIPAHRYNILDLLPPGPITGVEIGTDTGINARELLLQRPDLFLYTVDPYGYCLGYEEHKDPGRAIARREYEQRIGEFVRCGRSAHIRLPSVEAAKHFSGKFDYEGVHRCMSFNFVYIDGDHGARAVREDLAAWWPLLLVGGLMAGHDFEDPGVHTPVIQFCKAHRLDLHVLNEHGGAEDMGKGPEEVAWTGAAASHPDRRPGTGFDMRIGGWSHPSFYFYKPYERRHTKYE